MLELIEQYLTSQTLLLIVSGIIFLYVLNRFFSGSVYKGTKPDLYGKTAIITGGNTGIGKVTAEEFAKLGCRVIIGARDRAKSEEAVKQIKQNTNNQNIQFITLDLGDRKSIEDFVSAISFQNIDFLINNAGVMAVPDRRVTKDGFEMQYGINHLGHFLLTHLLWPKLVKSDFFRVINISSKAHIISIKNLKQPDLDFENINFEKGEYHPWIAYSRSKIYNVLFSKALAKKIPEGKGLAASLHPGSVRTELLRYQTQRKPIIKMLLSAWNLLYVLFTKSPWEGTQTTLHCSFDPKVVNGQYYEQCRIGKKNSRITQENWNRLWRISEEAWNIKF